MFPGAERADQSTTRRIRRLPELLVNQIAAGEVVERPASVVKELIDNAIDAGATRISVDLERGGIELVRVTDDGSGIPPDDVPLALAPHATSKIAVAEDLDRIATMGFRGEALASIASVSRLSLRTRSREQPGASLLEAEGEIVGAVQPAPGAVGTSVIVRNLFFNTPARRKFLRTQGTEQGHCLDVIRELALSHPAIGFCATTDGRAVLDLPPNQSPRERVLAVMGKELAEQFVESSADEMSDARGLALWGMVGLPVLARATAKCQHVFLNGRPIRDKTIQHALREAYRGLIEPGRYPTAVIMLEMDPGAVDVNVHPAKAEVRFRDGSMVHGTVLRSVREALSAADLTPSVNSAGFGAARGYRPGEETAILPREGAPTGEARANAFVEFFARTVPETAGRLSYDAIRDAMNKDVAAAAPAEQPAPVSQAMEVPRPADRLLQVHNSYVVTQDEQGLVIVDQHALHERVMFEHLLARVGAGDLESQRMLMPAVVPATTRQVERLQELAPLLKRIGVVLEPLGPAVIGVQAFPTFLFDRGVDEAEFVQGILEKTDDEGFVPGGEEALAEVLDMMACKAAVKAGNHLSDQELRDLLKMRDLVERGSNCPHGRPTSIRLTIRELERRFGRS